MLVVEALHFKAPHDLGADAFLATLVRHLTKRHHDLRQSPLVLFWKTFRAREEGKDL